MGPLCLPKVLIGTGQKLGPTFGARIEPAKRVDPQWVHPFCGLHSGPKCGRCFCGPLAACCCFFVCVDVGPCWYCGEGVNWVLLVFQSGSDEISAPCPSAISSAGSAD